MISIPVTLFNLVNSLFFSRSYPVVCPFFPRGRTLGQACATIRVIALSANAPDMFAEPLRIKATTRKFRCHTFLYRQKGGTNQPMRVYTAWVLASGLSNSDSAIFSDDTGRLTVTSCGCRGVNEDAVNATNDYNVLAGESALSKKNAWSNKRLPTPLWNNGKSYSWR